jgi:2-polyprenyl-3-methyl-5-hydroxy-6-metoxy-1,4-benzoquinol methylase
MRFIATITGLSMDTDIRTSPRPHCALCGSAGGLLHPHLTDRLFGASGTWSLTQCPTTECGLAWLDPMPLPEDIGKAYADYYTHTAQDMGNGAGFAKRTYLRMKRAYLSRKYGYGRRNGEPPLANGLGRLLYLFPLRRRKVDVSVRFLTAVAGGRLLDVGCGAGEWLGTMRELGWQAEGVDFDENAVRVAREAGLNVQCGAVEDQHFPDGSFDAVTMHHVIEHVPDPVATLKECTRILKSGGKLVMVTPNNASLSHRVFKNYWRGLEPPRHLHIFTPNSMRRALRIAGMQDVIIHPVISSAVIAQSVMIRRGYVGATAVTRANRATRLKAQFFNLAEWRVAQWKPSVADYLAAVATKQ